MAEKLILNAVMNRKADFYETKKYVVEKVIDVYETEFKKCLKSRWNAIITLYRTAA